MMETSATVICDSINDQGERLTTLEVTMHRFVLAEFNTHRVFSRNSASSRAIPSKKTIAKITLNPACPIMWPAEKSGMQGGDPISPKDIEKAKEIWLQASRNAIGSANEMVSLGVHKSIVNRLLEPFMWHTVIVSSTEWDNFWGLRMNPLAQPEIAAAATLMHDAYLASRPSPLAATDWHLPYLRPEDESLPLDIKTKICAARCARVSYLTHTGVRDIAKDLALYERLTSSTPPHASPLEHVARPCPTNTAHQHFGNFQGWDQLRHLHP